MFITAQVIGLWKSLQFNTTNPDTKAVCDTAPSPHSALWGCHSVTLSPLLQEHFLPWETDIETCRLYLLMFPTCYSVKLSLFPFRAGVDDIYSNTTSTGNIGFWMPAFAGRE